jgi:alpha-beta hydrolase superfamily lysophospholipase
VPTARTPLLLIHGAWLTSESWETFAGFFSDRGYEVTAPEWPRKRMGAAAQRDHSGEIADLGVEEIVDHFAGIVEGMEAPPVIMGHSFGGLFTELLLDRGLGRAGVCLSPAAPKGVLRLPFSQLKAGAPALAHPSRWHGVAPLDLEEFTYGFVNTWPQDAAADAYARYYAPETGRIFVEAGTANFRLHGPTEVDYHREGRAPMLLVGAERDHTVPASVVRSQYAKYEGGPSPVEHVEFAGRPHLFMTGDGWAEVAEHIARWLERNAA